MPHAQNPSDAAQHSLHTPPPASPGSIRVDDIGGPALYPVTNNLDTDPRLRHTFTPRETSKRGFREAFCKVRSSTPGLESKNRTVSICACNILALMYVIIEVRTIS